MNQQETRKPLDWIKQSKKRLKEFPEEVQDDIGYSLDQIQRGAPHPRNTRHINSLEGVREIVSRHDGNTYRAFYTTKFKEVVFVLHCFQKKAKRGIKTPDKEIELARNRMREAQKRYDKHYMGK